VVAETPIVSGVRGEALKLRPMNLGSDCVTGDDLAKFDPRGFVASVTVLFRRFPPCRSVVTATPPYEMEARRRSLRRSLWYDSLPTADHYLLVIIFSCFLHGEYTTAHCWTNVILIGESRGRTHVEYSSDGSPNCIYGVKRGGHQL
jgi:hypothetical protein